MKAVKKNCNIRTNKETDNVVSLKINIDDRKRNQEHPYTKFAVVNTLIDSVEAQYSIGGLSLLWQIAPDKEITGDCWRVLACLICKLDFDNYLIVAQTDLGNHLGISRTTVNRCIKTLENKHILERGVKIGNLPTFKLNPNFGWVGDNSNLKVCLLRKS